MIANQEVTLISDKKRTEFSSQNVKPSDFPVYTNGKGTPNGNEHVIPTQNGSVLTPLAEAAQAMNERAYLQACATIDWQKRTPEEFIQAIQHAFAAGAHMAARQLAKLGAERHPTHGEMQKYARILAPPRVIASNSPPDLSAKANRDWLVHHSAAYRGRWVAVRNGTLLHDATSLKELTSQFGVTPDILYTRVP